MFPIQKDLNAISIKQFNLMVKSFEKQEKILKLQISPVVKQKGTFLNIGRAEKQVTKTGSVLKGDEDQILLPLNYPLGWIKEIRNIPSR